MALSEAELKAQIYSPIPEDMQTEAETLWTAWFREASAYPNRDLIIRVNSLTYLQGKLWEDYNVRTGRDQRDAFQRWQAVTQMLAAAKDDLKDAGGAAGTTQTYAGITNMRAKPLVTSCGPPYFRHGKGRR